MAEYINREDALEFPFANGIYDHEHANEHFISGCESYREWIKQIPAADVVERETGKWIDMGDFEQCSACKGTRLKEFESYYGKVTWIKTPYCPNCGARMIGGDDNGA